MKKVIRLTESDLHKIINESVNNILNEGNFWNNIQGAVQGAYGGYQARKGANNMNKYSEFKNDQDQQGLYNNSVISKSIDTLYQNIGWFADDWRKNGWRAARDAYRYIETIKREIQKIENGLNSVAPDQKPMR